MVPEINLLPQMERKSGGSKWGTLLVLIAFIAIVGVLAFQYFSLTGSVKTLQADQQALLAERTAIEAKIAELEQPEQMDLATMVGVLDRITYPVSPLVEEINAYRGDDVYLREFILKENEIEILMDFETMPETATYVGDLLGSVYFEDVKVDEIETFVPTPGERKTELFDVVDRFANRFIVTIDPTYLRTGGIVQ
ncbi:PilN domain-containing protein [Sporosarcina sp. FSL K6-3457]|uniref:PilN domain-containing protein n=1 Tax=Sporosarcina sp. FSL K6-3457 TaxID=2978204 RepID=UPI0030FA40B3